MATFGDIIEEVLINLEGFSGDQEIFGTLSGNITNVAATLTVAGPAYADGSGFSTGLIEVGEELIYVQTFDRATGIATGCLRGWRGTTAVAAVSGVLLRNNPKFPRITVKRAINDTIQGLVPKITTVKRTTIAYKGGQVRYDLPSDAKGVLQVETSVPGASKTWAKNKRYAFDIFGSNTTPGAPAIDIWDGMPGRNIQVIYLGDPQPMVNLADDFATVTGLLDWARELVAYGACWRLASFIDSSKINTASAEQVMFSQQQPVGSAINLSKYFLAMYNTRLVEAQSRIQDLYPVNRHYIN